MNYTKQVREYCGKHSKGLIDISVVRNTVFADIPYKTLLKIFNRLEIDLVSLLEILDVGFGIRGGDYLTYRNVVELLAKTYTDDNFKQVIGAIRYKYSTIIKLHELLTRLNIKNACLDFFG